MAILPVSIILVLLAGFINSAQISPTPEVAVPITQLCLDISSTYPCRCPCGMCGLNARCKKPEQCYGYKDSTGTTKGVIDCPMWTPCGCNSGGCFCYVSNRFKLQNDKTYCTKIDKSCNYDCQQALRVCDKSDCEATCEAIPVSSG